jgi:SAM-dependent methyltransferase
LRPSIFSGRDWTLVTPDQLPCVGMISNPSHDVLGLFAPYVSVAGGRVLCVGYNEDELARLVEPYAPREIVCLTNWADHPDAKVARHSVVLGDLCARTPFDDDTFDAVLLFSVLEHLHDVEAALREVRRIVVPGGHLAILYGPAWSSAYGHHLYADADDPRLNFARWKLPAHMHLLCTPNAIRQWYDRLGYPASTADTVLGWCFDTTIINRRFHEDNAAALARAFQTVALELMYNDLPRDHVRLLRSRFPGYHDFATYGGKFLLRIPR